jgi:hypothetical protein
LYCAAVDDASVESKVSIPESRFNTTVSVLMGFILQEENAANLIREAEKCLAKRMTRVSFSSETKRSDAAVPSQDE